MIKPIALQADNITIDGKPDGRIGEFSKKDLISFVQSGIVDVYHGHTYVAQMTANDYREYSKTFGTPTEDAAYTLFTTEQNKLLQQYPGASIQSIIGFVLSQKLYKTVILPER